jgi:hypothetical protein
MNQRPIRLFDKELLEWNLMVTAILGTAPVKNLTYEEVSTTLRLIEIEMILGNPKYVKATVYVFKNDKRMSEWTDTDKFLALLVEADQQDLLLRSKRCMYCFGGSLYHWRKIGRTSPVTTVASAIGEYSGGYYGRGWVIAPHIKTLIKWMKDDNEVMEVTKALFMLNYMFQ